VLTDSSLLERCGLAVPTVTKLFEMVGFEDRPLTIAEGAARLSDLLE